MKRNTYLREEACRLRTEERWSLTEITEELKLSKGTIYYWIKDLPLTVEEQNQRKLKSQSPEAAKKASLAMEAKCRSQREAAYGAGREEFMTLDKDPIFRQFITLYIVEGYKRGRNAVTICNTDPRVIKFTLSWFQRLVKDPSRIRFRLLYYPDHNEKEIAQWWTDYLSINVEEITCALKSTDRSPEYRRAVHSIFRLHISDTLLRSRLQAWIDLTHAGWEVFGK